jgi:putative ABC transport system permease protein
MSFLSALRVALAALLVNKGRSALTSLGIVLGIAAVVALVSAGDGARSQLDDRMASLGRNLILVRSGARPQNGTVVDPRPLKPEDAEAIRRQVGPMLRGVAPVQLCRRNISAGSHNWDTSVTGTTPDMRSVRDWTFTAGRFFDKEEVARAADVCVLGETVRSRLFPDDPAPLGRTVRVDRVRLQVVGVLGPKGKTPAGQDQDDEVFVPLTTLQRKVAGQERVTSILTAVDDETLTRPAMAEISRVLSESHKVRPGEEDFDVASVSEMAEVGYFVTNQMQLLVAVIASISLVVGGIGIMNIKLVSVSERTREVGLRMAVGATSWDVLAQFLLEAVVLALGRVDNCRRSE